MKKFIFFFLILIFSFNYNIKAKEIKILYKLENEIITNQDLISELNYLIALNNNLKSLEKRKLNQIAINSIIKEKIKYLELIKYFKIDDNNEEVDKIVFKELYNRLNLNDIDSLNKYFLSYDLNLDLVKFKIKIELFWNKLIYDKYYNKISVNKSDLKNKILKNFKQQKTVDEYFLKEILFSLEENENLIDKYNNILKTIEDTGFENAANIFSISNTSKFGGEIGWISKLQLSNKITDEIDKIEIGGITNSIPIGNGYLIIKVDDKRKIKSKIDIDKETAILVQKETDRQLNQHSVNFFNKLKKNIFIYEL